MDHPSAGRAFYLFDGMGSVVNLMTPQGTVLGRYQWDAWGNKRASVETAANPFGFTGHEHDEETGLVYAKARFYDPQLGLFLSQDPVAGDPMNPPSLHRYLYGFQNPTVYVDPDGRIEFLRKLKEKFTEAAEDAIELAEEIGKESKIAGILAAVPLGVAAASAELVGSAIGTVNTVTNVAIAASGAEGRLADEAALEIDETIDSVKTTVKAIVENPGAVAAAVVDGVVETAKGVLEGDAGAIARATRTITSIALPAPGAGATKLAGALTKAVKKGGAVAARAGLRVVRAAAGKTFQALRRLGGTRLGKVAKVISGKTRHLRNKVRGLAHRLRRWTASRVRGKSAEPTYCFVAGTLVDTELGLRPIEEIEVGDRVWSRDEETGEISLQPVTELFVTPSQETLELQLEASDGTIETLGVTSEHPFWVVGEGWVEAGNLAAGDELLTERDGWLKVRQVRGSPGTRTVYNFEVQEDHTYFVGQTKAWVHNVCKAARKRIKREFKETGAVGGRRPTGSFGEFVRREREVQASIAGSRLEPILFGQKRIGQKFGSDPRFPKTSNRPFDDVVADLKSGDLTPDDLPITAFRDPRSGSLVSANTRTRAALADAGKTPTRVEIKELESLPQRAQDSLLGRLAEPPILPDSPLPSRRVPMTRSRRDMAIIRVIEILD